MHRSFSETLFQKTIFVTYSKDGKQKEGGNFPKINNMLYLVSKQLFSFGYKRSGSKLEASPILCQKDNTGEAREQPELDSTHLVRPSFAKLLLWLKAISTSVNASPSPTSSFCSLSLQYRYPTSLKKPRQVYCSLHGGELQMEPTGMAQEGNDQPAQEPGRQTNLCLCHGSPCAHGKWNRQSLETEGKGMGPSPTLSR